MEDHSVQGHSCEGVEEASCSSAPRWAPESVRFQLVPRRGWDKSLQMMRCAARNTLGWKGGDSLPYSPHPCWLLPAADKTAEQIAARKDELRNLGWKLFTCDLEVILRLGNKRALRDYAEKLGLLEHFPEYYVHASVATYPCILKAASGDFGKDCDIVDSVDDVRKLARWGGASDWVLQELVLGCFEYATSLLVRQGEILDAIGTVYEYNSDAYVWPRVEEVSKGSYVPSESHMAIMKELVQDYIGICNFNYKIRQDGRMCIFEINTRVGGDLATDVPRERAQSFFAKLDDLSTDPAVAAMPAGDDSSTPTLLAPPQEAPYWEEPMIIEPANHIHKYTLVYLHAFNVSSLKRVYAKKAETGSFGVNGLRIVMMRAPARPISRHRGAHMPSWYDFLEEETPEETSLADSRSHVFAQLDAECARFRACSNDNESINVGGPARVLLGGCGQGCGVALDAALRYHGQLMGFLGVAGRPLDVTPRSCNKDIPLHFFNGADDEVNRWEVVSGLLENLRQDGYEHVVVHGPMAGVGHRVSRELEANCIREALQQCST
eukprot:TRINITY_DN2602_c0_g1_i2.p1 TRINITY_DN2602_c0_g1~~TRINITY_DN2602_c0_g1_i2.p1  ORF type:complete len:550 (-),score=61.17 TRINITY_DN2602_c0_g1_i2:132-1781(-)